MAFLIGYIALGVLLFFIALLSALYIYVMKQEKEMTDEQKRRLNELIFGDDDVPNDEESDVDE